MATDASDVAIGGVLSQVQDGYERVLAYWSRQLQKAERNYSTIEREALAVVGAVKEFYPYLYGFPFRLLTDHNPLTSLKGMKDTGGRLTRWLLFLQQFNFTVEYKKGVSNTNADALSRRPPSDPSPVATKDTDLCPTSTNLLIRAQQEDPQLVNLRQHLEKNTFPQGFPPGFRKCFVKDGLICRQYTEANTSLTHTQVVVPTSLKNTILQEVHNQLGHFRVRKTFDHVKTRFYWLGYEQDVECWVKQCDQCQRRNPPHATPVAPLGTIQASYPFEKISWDIMGPLPTSSQGNKYILVVTDLFTKWVEAFPLKDTTTNTLATILLNEIVCRYGVPTSLHSDQGANLCSSVIHSLCQMLGITNTRTSAYHPQGNGQVERFNRTVEAMLSKMVNENQHDWDSQLPKALFAYRTAVHEVTKFSPFHLTFARSPQLPIDVILGRLQHSKISSCPQFVQAAHHQMKASYTTARECLKAQHARQQRTHGLSEEFHIGDRVWLYTPVVPKGHTKKFTSFWKGPYTILDKPGPVNYKIQLIGGTQQFVVHHNRLKLCHTPPLQQPSLSKVPTQSQPELQHHNALYSDVTAGRSSGIAGYTSITNPPMPPAPAHSDTRPLRARRPPARYDAFVRH